jgi:hypothetical protein
MGVELPSDDSERHSWLQQLTWITHTHTSIHTYANAPPVVVLDIDSASMIPPEQSFQIEI